MKTIPVSIRGQYVTRVGAFLIAAALVVGTVLVGMADYPGTHGVYNPYPSENLEIRTWYDLDAVRYNLTGNYTLMNPLDSTTAGYQELASEIANQGKGWQPIGTWEDPYRGNFDGRAWEIRDLFVNRPDENLVGLFGIVGEGAVIENVGVWMAVVTGGRGVGGPVGRNWDATVNSSYFATSVSSNSGIGGLVGYSRGTVVNCYFAGNVTGGECVGGLVGQNCGPVSHCFATGSVIGESCVGGLVGDNFDTVSNCFCAWGCTVVGEEAVGGLVGQNVYGTVTSSYFRGSVTGNSKVGGLMGTNIGTVSDSYSNANVIGYSRVGGLEGWNIGTTNNSYATGSVTGADAVGGLLGDNVYGTVGDSFWDIETSGQATSDGGVGKTTEEMKNIATFSSAGWSITAVGSAEAPNPACIWNIIDEHMYPFLSWHIIGWPLPYPRGHILPTQQTSTTPSGYLGLTVSPAEVCANIGEQIEIRCNINPLVDTPVEISSVDVLLFDSCDDMVREQRMTKDYPSFHTVYTIVGDEAYYRLKVNFTFPLGEPGEHSEYGVHSFRIVVKT